MRFWQFILKGIFIGGVLFFPTKALAEEVGQAQKMPIHHEKAAVQKQKPASLEKAKKPKAPVKHKKLVVKKPTAITHSSKPVLTKKILPEQASLKAKEDRQASVPNNKRNSVKHILEKKAASHGKEKHIIKQQNKEKTLSKQDITKKPFHSKEKKKFSISKEIEPVDEINIQRPIVIEKNMIQKVSVFDKQAQPKKSKIPNPITSYPDDLLLMMTQSNYYLSGPSRERKNLDHSLYSFSDKWLIKWERYWLLGPNTSFGFQSYKICNQWMNAPPFQPPKNLLFS